MPAEITELVAGTSIFVVLVICGITVLSLAFTAGIVMFVTRAVRNMVNPAPGIQENGIPARAKILSVRQTGAYINQHPQIALQLEVNPPGDVPYQIETKAIIPMIHIPQFQPGAEVPVKIHPTDLTKVALDIHR